MHSVIHGYTLLLSFSLALLLSFFLSHFRTGTSSSFFFIDSQFILRECYLSLTGKTWGSFRKVSYKTSNLLKHPLPSSTWKWVTPHKRWPSVPSPTLCCSPTMAAQPELDLNCGQQFMAGYLVEEMVPVSTADSPCFRDILGKLHVSQKTRKHLLESNQRPFGHKTSYLTAPSRNRETCNPVPITMNTSFKLLEINNPSQWSVTSQSDDAQKDTETLTLYRCYMLHWQVSTY